MVRARPASPVDPRSQALDLEPGRRRRVADEERLQLIQARLELAALGLGRRLAPSSTR